MRSLLLGLALILASARSGVAETKSEALAILERAIAGEKDSRVLTKALAELDALVAANPKNSDAHYARGWVLSHAKNDEAAVVAYDRAFDLDPRLADAAYNAGVVLGRLGNAREAAARFDRALKGNAKHVDAAYNGGQSYYDLGEFANAAARWETAMKLQPDDFQIAKKLVQAYVALGRPDKVKKARDHVFAMWKSGKDPELAKLKSYVYDQFVAGKFHVYVYEHFDPTIAVFQAKVALGDKVIGSVTLEPNAAGFIVAIEKDGEHTTIAEHSWKRQPEYKTWKSIATSAIENRF